jgi:putative YpdA family bacillithiol system oxidoreductase
MSGEQLYDVLIVGAGPAGLSAAAHAEIHKLRYVVLEKGTIANTFDYYYQYGKYVMALPAVIPLRSDLAFQAGSRESVLKTWTDSVATQQLHIRTNEVVNDIKKLSGHFEIITNQATYTAEKVVVAIGKLGNPRKLGAPGEELRHVSDRLVDPRAYTNQDILVVGAGDSAAEVALALSEHNRVVMSYRGPEFYRMNESLLRQITDKIESRDITVYFGSTVERIAPGVVALNLPDRTVRVQADWVFVKIGAEVPRHFLERCGVAFSSTEAAAVPVINERYESSVPGLFLIGAVGGQDLIKHAMNQGYEVIEHMLGHTVEPVDEPALRQRLQAVPGATVLEQLTCIASRVPLLAPVPLPQLREFLLVSTIHQVDKGHTLFREHDYSTTFFTILEGSVDIFTKAEPAHRVVRRQGEFFGEMSLLADRRRSATVETAERCLLLEIPRRTMLQLMHAYASVRQRIDEAYILRALQTYLGPALAAADFQTLAAKAELVTRKKGEVLFHEGDPGDAFYVIRSGAVKISKKNKDGQDYVITYRSAGQYVGEMALLETQHTRGATVSAATRTEVIRILKDDFLAFLARHPNLQQQIEREMGQRHLETAVILGEPDKTTLLTDFIAHGVVESTDVLLIDETKCIRCDNCVTACAATHEGQTRLDRKHGPSFAYMHVPIACRHCEGAPCLQDCPPGDAIVRNAEGVVTIEAEKCIGCGNCARLCPYGVIFMVEAPHQQTFWERFNLLSWLTGKKPTSPAGDGHRGIAVKCDLCQDVSGGPACVRSCPTGAAIRVTPEYFTLIEFH